MSWQLLLFLCCCVSAQVEFTIQPANITTEARDLHLVLKLPSALNRTKLCRFSFSPETPGQSVVSGSIPFNLGDVESTTTFSAPPFLTQGMWTLSSLQCTTSAGVTENVFAQMPSSERKQIQFEQTGVQDTDPPVVTFASVFPYEIDTSQNPTNIRIEIGFADQLAGVTSCKFQMLSPSGSHQFTTTVQVPFQVRNNGSTSYKRSMARGSPKGTYRLTKVFCTDARGLASAVVDSVAQFNALPLQARQNAALGIPLAVTQRSGPSFQQTADPLLSQTYPSVLSFELSPTSVNTSLGPQIVKVQIAFYAHVGISYCQAYFSSSMSRGSLSYSARADVDDLISGNRTVGVLETHLVIPVHTPTTFLQLTNIQCFDVTSYYVLVKPTGSPQRYNTWHLMIFSQLNLPQDYGIKQVGFGDASGVHIKGVQVLTKQVNASAASVPVRVSFEFADDFGIIECGISFSRPETTSTYFSINLATSSGSHQLQGTTKDGKITGSATLAAYAPQGVFNVRSIFCRDAFFRRTINRDDLKKELSITDAELEALSFEQLGAEDVSGPEIQAFTFTPTQVDTSQGPATVQLSWSFKDDRSGVRFCAARFTPTSGPGSASVTQYVQSASLISGTEVAGTIQSSVSLPHNAAYGLWKLTQLNCADKAGHSTYLYPDNFPRIQLDPDTTGIFQSGQGDIEAPQIQDVVVSPNTIDTSVSSQRVSITISFTDNQSGVRSCTAGFWLPNTRINTYTGSSSVLTEGTNLNGKFVVTITISAFAQAGFFALSYVSCTDNAQQSETISNPEFLPYLGIEAPGFSQTGKTDTKGPVITSFDFSPQTIDTSAVAQGITAVIDYYDDYSGISHCSIAFQSQQPDASPSSFSISALRLENGNSSVGTVSGSNSFPRFATKGVWRLSNLRCQDRAGQQTEYTYFQVIDFFGLSEDELTITQTGTGDSSPPQITAVSINTLQVDTSLTAQTVEMSVSFVDLHSGVSRIYVYFENGPKSLSPSFAVPLVGTSGSRQLVSGSPYNGTMIFQVTVPKFSLKGFWSLKYVRALDNKGLSTYVYSSSGQLGLSASSGFTQLAAGDVLPPSIHGVFVEPASVDTSKSSAAIAVRVNVSDDVSGVSRCEAHFGSPLETNPYATSFTVNAYASNGLVSGDIFNGVIAGQANLPRFSAAGQWTLSRIFCYDVSGRSATLNSPFPKNFNMSTSLGFLQSGVSDVNPPVIVDFVLRTTVVDTSNNAAPVSACISFSDDYAGVSSCRMNFFLPGTTSTGFQIVLSVTPANLVRGTAQMGTVCGSTSLARYSQQGEWIASSVLCYDQTNKNAQVTKTQFRDYNISKLSFTQVGTADTTAPAITALSFSPTTIDTSVNEALVTMTISFVELGQGASGMDRCSCTFNAPANTGGSSVGTTVVPSSLTLSGSIFNGTLTGTLTFRKYSTPGMYPLSSCYCRDKANRYRYLYPADISQYFETPFQGILQTGEGDVAGPTIVSLKITPLEIDTSEFASAVTATVRATDDVSGVASCSIFFFLPETTSRGLSLSLSSTSSSVQVGGTPQNRTLTGNVNLARYSKTGFWQVEAISCSDGIRSTTLPSSAFGSLQNQSFHHINPKTLVPVFGFTQIGQSDTEPPEILDVKILTKQIDTSASRGTISVSVAFTDDISGLDRCRVSFANPGTSSTSFTLTLTANPSSLTGSINSGIVTGQYILNQYSAQGFYPVTSVFCEDRADRGQTYSLLSLPSAPFVVDNNIDMKTFGFTQTGVPDLQGPEILSLFISPNSVRVTSSAIPVQFTVSFVDLVSGVSSCYITFLPVPGGTKSLSSTVSLSPSSLIAGTSKNGTLSGNVFVPAFSPKGTFTFNYLRCTDVANRQTYLYSKDVTAKGLSLADLDITQTFQGDTKPPNITSFSVSPNSIDTSTTDVKITVAVGFEDDVAGVNYCQVYFYNPDNSHAFTLALHTSSTLVSGTITDGSVRGQYTIPQHSKAGFWSVYRVQCSDHGDRITRMDASALVETFGLSSANPLSPNKNLFGFKQTGQADTTPPQLLGFSMSPLTVNTAQSPQTIMLTFEFEDDISGVNFCNVRIDSPTGSSSSYSVSATSTTLASGSTQTKGTMTGSFVMARFSAAGKYIVSTIYCQDEANQRRTYSRGQLLTDLNISPADLELSQTGVSDVRPPEITGFGFSPSTVDTSQAGVLMHGNVSFSDDVAGIDRCNLYFQRAQDTSGPAVNFYIYMYLSTAGHLVAGTQAQGTLAATSTLGRYSANGFYQLKRIACRDKANKWSYVYDYDLATDFNITQPVGFTQVGRADVVGAELTSFSLSPTTIDTSQQASSSFVIALTATDDASGVKQARVQFTSPSGSNRAFTLNPPDSSAPPSRSIEWSSEVSLPLYSETGFWKLNYVRLRDDSNKYTYYYSSTTYASVNLTGVGVNQIGVADEKGPKVMAVSLEPSTIDTTKANAQVTVAFTFTDDLAGVTSCSIQFNKPNSTDLFNSVVGLVLSSGTVTNGVGTLTVFFARGSLKGFFNVRRVGCGDASGKWTYIYTDDIPFVFGINGTSKQAGVMQIGRQDQAAPVLFSATVQPSSIDTSATTATVMVTLIVSDDAVGINYCDVQFWAPETTSSQASVRLNAQSHTLSPGSSGVDQDILSANPSAIAMRTTMTMSRYSKQGKWLLSYVRCYDQVYKNDAWYRSQAPPSDSSLQQQLGLSDADFADLGFSQVGKEDAVGVTIEKFSVSPQTINTATGPATLTMTLQFSDDLSGASRCYVYWSPPENSNDNTLSGSYAVSSYLTSGTIVAGTIRFTMTMAQHSAKGKWTINYLRCRDVSGKNTYVYAKDFPDVLSLSETYGFNQVGTGDLTGPQITGFTVVTEKIDTSESTKPVTVTFAFTDDVSGVTSCQANFYRPGTTSSAFTVSTSVSSSNLASGTQTKGTVSATNNLAYLSQQGFWKVWRIGCRDGRGKWTFLNTDQMKEQLSLEDVGFEQEGKSDDSAPEILGLELSPKTVNTSQAAVKLSVAVSYLDDVSGVLWCQFRLKAPTNKIFTVTMYVDSHLRDGDKIMGNVTGVITLPQHSPEGFYALDYVRCRDNVNKYTYLYNNALHDIGLDSSFGVNQVAPGDENGPEILDVNFSPKSFSTKTDSATITFSVSMQDNLSGVTSCQVSYYLPESSSSTSVTLNNLVSGSATRGVMSGSRSLARWSPKGAYRIYRVGCVDALGLWTFLDPTVLGKSVTDLQFTQTANGDSNPPKITAFKFSPVSINTASGSATLSYTFGFTDDASGVTQCRVQLEPPAGTSGNSITDTQSFSGSAAISGTATKGQLRGTMHFPQYSLKGKWTIDYLRCRDASGKYGYVYASSLPSFINPSFVTQTGDDDREGPKITAFTVTPLSFDTSKSTVRVTVRVNVQDKSGVTYCRTEYRAPPGSSGRTSYSITSRPSSGNVQTNGAVEGSTTFAQYIAQGEWTLSSVICYDKVGFRTTLPVLSPLIGSAAVLRQTGKPDLTGPDITDVTFSPSTVDTSQGSKPITFTVSFTDDLAGVNYCRLYLLPPTGTQDSSRSASASASSGLVLGSIVAGTVQGTLSLPQWSVKGKWRFYRVICLDRAGRSTSISDSSQPPFGSLPSIVTSGVFLEQTGLGDTQVPSIKSFTLKTKTANTADGSVAISASASYSDDVSGVNSVRAYFNRPEGTNGNTFVLYLNVPSSDRRLEGSIESSSSLPRFSSKGTYTLIRLAVYDRKGRSANFYSPFTANGSPDIPHESRSFEQTGEGDESPPTVKSIKISPSSFDTALSDVDITITWEFEDDASGIYRCYVNIDPHEDADDTAGDFSFYADTSRGKLIGSPQKGSLELVATIPQHTAQGTFVFDSVYCRDTRGRNGYLEDIESETAFEQTGPGDTELPVITALSFSPKTLASRGDNADLTFSWSFTDDQAGIDNCYFRFESPEGGSFAFSAQLSSALSEGTPTDGTMTVRARLPRYMPKAKYTLDMVYCNDKRNLRHTILGGPTMQELLGDEQDYFDQTSENDEAGPEIFGFEAMTRTVATGDSAGMVSFLWSVADTGSMVSRCTATFSPPADALYANTLRSSFSSSSSIISGDLSNGEFISSLSVPRYSPKGVFTLTSISCQDMAGRQTILSPDSSSVVDRRRRQWRRRRADTSAAASTLDDLGWTASKGLEQTSPGDEELPKIVSFSLQTSSVNTAKSRQFVYASFTAEDDLSGVTNCYATFSPPEGIRGRFFSLSVSGIKSETIDSTSGKVETVLSGGSLLPQYSLPGTYQLSSFYCRDRSGKRSIETPADITGAEDASFEQTGASDRTPPVLESLSISPSSFRVADLTTDFSTSGNKGYAHIPEQQVKVTFIASDVDGSGLTYCRADFRHSVSSRSFRVYAYPPEHSTKQTTFHGSATFTPDSDAGTWTLTYVACYDLAANVFSTSNADQLIEFAGSSRTVTQEGGLLDDLDPTVDKDAPISINRVSFSPSVIDTSDHEVNVTLTVDFEDLMGFGVTECSVRFLSPASAPVSADLSIYVTDCDHLVSGTVVNGRFRGYSRSFPVSSAPGAWQLSFVYCENILGYGTTLRAGPALDAVLAGSPSHIEQRGDVHLLPPQVTSINFAPSSFSTTSGPVSVTVTADVTDPSGLKRCFVYFQSPVGSGQGSLRAELNATFLTSGSMAQGSYTSELIVPRYSASGLWALDRIYCQNNIRSITLNGFGLTALGLASGAGLSQIGKGDTSAPTINTVTLSPNSVDTFSEPATITLTLQVSEPHSALDSCRGTLAAPYVSGVNAPNVLFLFATPESSLHGTLEAQGGSQKGNLITMTKEMPQWSLKGDWTLTSVACTNVAGMTTTLAMGSLESVLEDSTVTLTQTGDADEATPTIHAFDFAPKTVNTDGGDVNITLTITASDSESGVLSCSVQFASPTHHCANIGSLYSTLTAQDNTLSVGEESTTLQHSLLVIPKESAAGTYLLKEISCRDKTGNEIEYSGAALAALGLEGVGLLQTGSQSSSSSAALSAGATAGVVIAVLVVVAIVVVLAVLLLQRRSKQSPRGTSKDTPMDFFPRHPSATRSTRDLILDGNEELKVLRRTSGATTNASNTATPHDYRMDASPNTTATNTAKPAGHDYRVEPDPGDEDVYEQIDESPVKGPIDKYNPFDSVYESMEPQGEHYDPFNELNASERRSGPPTSITLISGDDDDNDYEIPTDYEVPDYPEPTTMLNAPVYELPDEKPAAPPVPKPRRVYSQSNPKPTSTPTSGPGYHRLHGNTPLPQDYSVLTMASSNANQTETSLPGYVGDMPRKDAETLVLDPARKTGDFVLRKSSTSDAFALTIRFGAQVRNLRISKKNDMWTLVAGMLFEDLGALMDHYLEHGLLIDNRLSVRLNPVADSATSTL
eukprot:m.90913 g.90913  ORF g.90913 m.90913 type:complete len:5352 (+) comp21611_c0_seq1:3-16058(+)